MLGPREFAAALVAPGRGILAADESIATMSRRLEAVVEVAQNVLAVNCRRASQACDAPAALAMSRERQASRA